MTGNKTYKYSLEKKCEYCGVSLRRLKNEKDTDKHRNIHSGCLKLKLELEKEIIQNKKKPSYFTFD